MLAPWTVTKYFHCFSWEGSLLGTVTDINEETNGSGDDASLSIGTLLENMEGALLPGL